MPDVQIRAESPPSTPGLDDIPTASPDQESGSEDEAESAPEAADTKAFGPSMSYQGFSIYGRTLCLVVKRRGTGALAPGRQQLSGSQQMMETWVSTQAAQGDPAE
jgi:hypothetical protein